MTNTNPVRFAILFVIFFCGVLSGLFGYSYISGKLFEFSGVQRRTIPLHTTVRGEETKVEVTERFINVDWLSFDEGQIQSVCRATEIVRKNEKVFLKDPILYDYSKEDGVVTRTSGEHGEAVLKGGVVKDLDTVRIWGKAMIFRYAIAHEEFVKEISAVDSHKTEQSDMLSGIQ